MENVLIRRLLLTGIGILCITIIGTFGYYFLTDRTNDLFSCFYMTVITITTIGFGEVIDLASHPGARQFTILIAISGIGLLTYFVSTTSAIIIEGHLRETFKKRRMEKTIHHLHNHYIICGFGRHSTHLIDELIATKRENVFIEIDPGVIKLALKKYPMQNYVEGDATSDEVLMKAGIDRATGLFAATTNDNLNLVISLSARRLNPNIKIVALCSTHSNMEKLKIAGADQVVSPNYIGALRMASEMVRPAVTTFLDVMLRDKDKNLRIEQVDLDERHEGKTFGELKIEEFKDTLLVAIKSNDEIIFKPNDDFKISPGDSLIVMTTPEERIKLGSI